MREFIDFDRILLWVSMKQDKLKEKEPIERDIREVPKILNS